MELNFDRVRAHSSPRVNDRIDRQIAGTLATYQDREQREIVARLAELDREWDIDRALMLFFGVLGSATLQLGLRKDRRFLNLLGVQAGLLGLHALVGWCPPVTLLRRLSLRTTREIELERRGLEVLLSNR